MESAAILRSFHGTIQRAHHEQYFREIPAMVSFNRIYLKTALWPQGFLANQALKSSLVNRRSLQPYAKALKISSAVASDEGSSEKISPVELENRHNHKSTFPSGFEALVLDVCDETNIAELKVKVGDFEMLLKRDVGSPKAYPSTASNIVFPTIAPPIPGEPMSESSLVAEPAPPPSKPSPSPRSPFAYVSPVKESKLATLEASGLSGYAIVSSPTVGSFQSGKMVKGNKQPPICKVGDVIKEGQIIGYLGQFGNELPIKSDLAGEVLKVLFTDGEPVGYGDPIVAVLPSFHGIE